MGKIFGIALIALGIWVGLTLYTEGWDRAFGGVFAGAGADPSRPAAAPADRVRERAEQAIEQGEQRIERGLED